MLDNKLEVEEEGRTKLTVVHNGEKLTFRHPPYGLGTYSQVKDLIENPENKPRLETPTLAQTASLVYAAFGPSEDEKAKENFA